MTREEMDRIIAQIAREQHITPAEVRREMELSLEDAMASTDPVVQARWAKIPRRGEKVTLEEFMDYVLGVITKES